MKTIAFPEKFQQLEAFSNRFDAFRLQGKECDVLFAMYPENTTIEPHTHETDNYGVITKGCLYLTIEGEKETAYKTGEWYHVGKHQLHSARFEEDTEEIEFWFK